MQQRGREIMGVDQYTSHHAFEDLPDGGRITLELSPEDTAGVAVVRTHLQRVAQAFARGDFPMPRAVHATDSVPGVGNLTRLRDRIRYVYRELAGGGEVRLITADPAAVRAIHRFLAFQRSEHRTGP